MSRPEPQDSLELIRAANRAMAERAKAPAYYHVTLGLLSGGLAASNTLSPPWQIAGFAIFLVGIGLLVRAYRRHTGMWISGDRPGRTRGVALCMAGSAVAIYLTGEWLQHDQGVLGAMLVAAALIAGVVTWSGYAWERAYRRDLGVETA